MFVSYRYKPFLKRNMVELLRNIVCIALLAKNNVQVINEF